MTSQPAAVIDSRDESLTWTVRPSDGGSMRLAVIFGAAMLAALLGYLLFHDLLLAMIGFGIILASTAEYWMGTRFALTEAEATRRVGPSVSSISWADVKRVSIEGNRIKLSPLEQQSRLDPFRGIVLQTTGDNRSAVIQAINRHCSSDVRLLGD
jgi:hypothetical protein